MLGKYTIIKLERKITRIGEIINADLQDFNGVITDKVAIFPTFPNFSTLKVGSEVMGKIDVKQNGVYTNKTLNEERTPMRKGDAPSINISKMMDKKAENIEKAQERKNDGIAYFNATNSAIALVGKMSEDVTPDFYKMQIVNWRDWFLSEWRKYDAGDVTDKKNPF